MYGHGGGSPHWAPAAHWGRHFQRGAGMRRPGQAGSLLRRSFANRFGFGPGYGRPYGPVNYGSIYGPLGYGAGFGPLGYGYPFGPLGYGTGIGPLGYGAALGSLAYGWPYGLFGYGWLGNVWPDTGWPDSGWQTTGVQYIAPPPPEMPPPQVIVISADARGQTPPPSGPLPDYSYVAGCHAIPNGYHCATAAGAN